MPVPARAIVLAGSVREPWATTAPAAVALDGAAQRPQRGRRQRPGAERTDGQAVGLQPDPVSATTGASTPCRPSSADRSTAKVSAPRRWSDTTS